MHEFYTKINSSPDTEISSKNLKRYATYCLLQYLVLTYQDLLSYSISKLFWADKMLNYTAQFKFFHPKTIISVTVCTTH